MEEKLLESIQKILLGTRYYVEDALEKLGIDPEDIDLSELEGAVRKSGLDRCPYCRYWAKVADLRDLAGNLCGCEDCRYDV